MAPRTLPGVGLSGFAPYQEDNWNTWADTNWRMISALLQGRVLSVVGSLPGSPTNGDMHILTSDQKVYVRDNGAWVSFTPAEGWRMYDQDTGLYHVFDGGGWVTDMVASNLTLTPPASVTPLNNGEVTFQLTSDTELTFVVKGLDGTVRTGSVTLS